MWKVRKKEKKAYKCTFTPIYPLVKTKQINVPCYFWILLQFLSYTSIPKHVSFSSLIFGTFPKCLFQRLWQVSCWCRVCRQMISCRRLIAESALAPVEADWPRRPDGLAAGWLQARRRSRLSNGCETDSLQDRQTTRSVQKVYIKRRDNTRTRQQ